MDVPIFFLDAFSSADILTLNEETSKHVVQVLRMKAKERLQLTDGGGNLLTAEIIDEHKKKCTVKIIERKVVAQKLQKVCVGVSLLKNASRFEWLLEKVTEIGATEIIPLLCERTEKQHFRYERMRQIVISAMMQSKQVWLPILQQPTLLSRVIPTSDYELKLIAHCEEEMKATITDFRKQESVQILIGPEGDFTKDEISSALDNGFKPVTLGETRLRTETAGVVSATVLCI
ncbi:MAG: rRNA ((1498)-N(3))-methyltransferase [Segetibacter sp.]|jgi:16S rRNA (uracil1498-N3)-methyltransferase|nr:rRNA ((1498)-N(3))-methyltransferase [Segetibacter sp.]